VAHPSSFRGGVPVERAVYIGVRSRAIRQVKEWKVLPSVRRVFPGIPGAADYDRVGVDRGGLSARSFVFPPETGARFCPWGWGRTGSHDAGASKALRSPAVEIFRRPNGLRGCYAGRRG